MGDGDSHRATDVRAVFEPIARFCEQFNIAMFLVTHPPKAQQAKAMNAFAGALAFIAAPRLGFLVVPDQLIERTLILPVKNNIGPKIQGLAYRIEGGPNSRGIDAPRIVWDASPVTMTANEAIHQEAEANRKPLAMRRCHAIHTQLSR
jgi:hypothetical protein